MLVTAVDCSIQLQLYCHYYFQLITLTDVMSVTDCEWVNAKTNDVEFYIIYYSSNYQEYNM